MVCFEEKFNLTFSNINKIPFFLLKLTPQKIFTVCFCFVT